MLSQNLPSRSCRGRYVGKFASFAVQLFLSVLPGRTAPLTAVFLEVILVLISPDTARICLLL